MGKRKIYPKSSLTRHKSVDPFTATGGIKDVEDLWEIREAKGFLNKLWNHLMPIRAGIATSTLLGEFVEKEHIRELAQQGTLPLTDEQLEMLEAAEDDDFRITMDTDGYHKLVEERLGQLTKKEQRRSHNLLAMMGELSPDIPLALELTIDKEWEETEKKFLWTKRPKKKLVVRDTEIIPLGLTNQSFMDYINETQESGFTRGQEIMKAGVDASVAALKGKEVIIKKRGGILEPSYTNIMKSDVPVGYEGHKAAVALGVVAEVAVPEPWELVIAAIQPAIYVNKFFKATKTGKKMFNALNNFWPTRVGMRWGGIGPDDVMQTKKTVQAVKGRTAYPKWQMSKEVTEELRGVMQEEAKGVGKKFDLRKNNIWWKKFQEWGEAGGYGELNDWVKPKSEGGLGRTLDAFFRNSEKMAEVLQLPVGTFEKYFTFADMRDIIINFEKATPMEEFSKTTKVVGRIIKEDEQWKLMAKIIDEEHLKWYKATDSNYFPHRIAGKQPKKGLAFTATNEKVTASKKRLHGLMDEFEQVTLETGHTPEYNIFTALTYDAEDAFNTYAQMQILDVAEKLGSIVKVNRIKEITDPKKAMKIVKKYSKYIKHPINDENLLRTANEVLSSMTPQRIIDEAAEGMEKGQKTILKMIDPENLDPKAMLKRGGIGVRKYTLYYPNSKMRIFPRQVWGEIEQSVSKMSDESRQHIAMLMDQVEDISKKGLITTEDMGQFFKILDDKLLNEAAPQTVLSVTRKTPMYVVSREVGDLIKDEVRTMMSPEMTPALRFLSRISQPFRATVTVWNPNFWKKYLSTDMFQLWKGGVPIWRIPGRFTQGNMVLTGKGFTNINGVKFANRELLNAIEQVGVRRNIRRMMSTDSFDVLLRATNDLLTDRQAWRGFKKGLKIPSHALSHVDDGFRIGLFLNRVEDNAAALGYKTKADIFKLFDDGAQWTWLHMFNYDDLPHVLKKMRSVFPFLSWKYHILPDQLRFLTQIKKMRQLGAGHLAMQSVLGLPDMPPGPDYLKRSPQLKWEPAPGTVYTLNLSLPYMQVLNFPKYEKMMEGMISMAQPFLQLPLLAGGFQLFPQFRKYKRTDRQAAPLSMYSVYKNVWNNKAFHRIAKPGMRYFTRDDGSSGAYLTVSKQFYDLYHIFTPFFIPVDENTKNVKLSVELEDVIRPRDKDEMLGMLENIEQDVTFDVIKKQPKMEFVQTRPGLAIREIDVDANFYRRLTQLQSMENVLRGMIQNYIQPARGFQELEDQPRWEIHDQYLKWETSREEILDFLADHPKAFEELEESLEMKSAELEAVLRDYLYIDRE